MSYARRTEGLQPRRFARAAAPRGPLCCADGLAVIALGGDRVLLLAA